MTEPPAESRLEQRIAELERENRELHALQDAGLDLQTELDLDLVLQKVVDQATELLEAKHGALSVIDSAGAIEEFVTSGIDADHRRLIGPPPKGAGLLAVPLIAGDVLNLADLTRDPRSSGFPANHPPMRSLLAVPVICSSPHRGNLYLADKRGSDRFSQDDQRTLQRFARLAAAAIDTAHLHQRSESLAIAEERLRISREIHDGVAQVLAYVNTKAQAARELLARGRGKKAIEQLDELAAAARGVYTEVREGILALRIQPSPDRSLEQTLREYADHWQQRGSTRVELEIDGDLRLTPSVQLQLVRIVQEALANVRKHAQAQAVEVRVARVDSELRVSIVDDGRGFDPARTAGRGERRFGLSVMRERAEGIGGSLTLESTPGKGTRIDVAVPTSSLESPRTGGSKDANPDSR